MDNDQPIVLHVDDEEDIRVIARLALETVGGLEVIQCASGPEALKLAPEKKPTLFLLDVMMPEMDGIQTLRQLRKLPGFENTPAFFMTAKVGAEDKEELLNCGAAAVIPKPFDPLKVAGEIVSMWREEIDKPQRPAATVTEPENMSDRKQYHET